MTDHQDRKQAVMRSLQGALLLDLAYIGIANGLFSTLSGNTLSAAILAQRSGMDPGYVHRWCEAAYAFELLETPPEGFCLSALGAAFLEDVPGTLMPFAVQSVLSAHMAERACDLMRTGERPGESVLAERKTVLPWFGPMLERQFGPMFAEEILPKLTVYGEADRRGGLVVDLGCGNGWYLRALAQRYPKIRGIGIDGFDENVRQAVQRSDAEGFGDRIRFLTGDIYSFRTDTPVYAIAMNRALHHVWDERERVFCILHDHLEPGGAAVIWEPNWPARELLRDPMRRVTAFQNLSEHVQGNHFLAATEIADAAREADLVPEVHLFFDGREAVVVARRAV
ncbi:MAG: class I SAM-dependent methyltransferase [Acidiferrobacteraceae bacterium]